MTERSSGILLHITSLPGKEGIGTFGDHAFSFVDFLDNAKQKLWQVLPLGPTGYGNSPYQCYSAFAGNPLLIDLNRIAKEGLLENSQIKKIPKFKTRQVDFQSVEKWKFPLLRKAFEVFKEKKDDKQYNQFLEENNWWLDDYALFMACKKEFGYREWNSWEKNIKFRKKNTLKEYATKLFEETEFHKFLQFIFYKQWFELKNYANSKGIKIIGDVPLYVANDSSDVWANPDIFLLDRDLIPTFVGGVPPDYFSSEGQLWGNPVFNWDRLKERDYDWWIARIHFNLKLYDFVRIDHFRGLESFWSVKSGEKTAVNGKWEPAFGNELLAKLKDQIGDLPLIAEDLGIITQEVKKLRNDFNLPGMKVLQFAFSSDSENEYLPHNYKQNFVAYTGTHDNDTTLGWYRSVDKVEKQNINNYLKANRYNISKLSVQLVWSSVANMAIAPLQDIIGKGSKARMNIPGTTAGNWKWRFRSKDIKTGHFRYLKELTERFGR